MKYKAKYSAESDIPADVKAFYSMLNGEWIFNGSEFEGLAELLNPGLAQNKEAILEEKRALTAAKEAADKQAADALKELATFKKPGTVVMSQEDINLLNSYKELGPIKDIQAKLDNEVELQTKVVSYETDRELRQLAKKLNLNEDALVDFKLNNARGKDIKLGSQTKKIKDAKGVEVDKDVLVVVTTDTVNGKEKESYVDFSDYAKTNNLPQYLVDAITASPVSADDKKKTEKTSFTMPTSIREKASAATGSEPSGIKKITERFNEERSTRRMPWDKVDNKT